MLRNKVFTALLVLCAAACSPENSGQSSATTSSKTLMPAASPLKPPYIQSCYSCHGTGVNGAPRTGNEAD